MTRQLLLGISCLGLIAIGVKMRTHNAGNATGSNVLRVAFPYAKSASAYEPARIHLAPEYIFLENIYSALVEISPKTGDIESGVAKSYRWEGNELHLVIRDDLKTVSGHPITSKDAEFSLKRLLALPGNTHGNFRELICGRTNLKSVEDHCDGIRVEGNELVLKTTDAGKTFLLPMLAAIDFAIIPRESVDPTTLKITNFQDTSGPYYVAKDASDGRIELRANPNHYHYSEKMPQMIELVPSNASDSHASLEDFKKGAVDFITTVDLVRADDVIAFSRERGDVILHTTMNIRSFVLTFSKRGLSELSPAERFAIGKRLRDSFARTFAGQNGYETSKQFFPAFGEGALDPERMKRITDQFESAGPVPSKRLKVAFVRLGDTSKFMAATREVLPDAELAEAPKNVDFLKYASESEMPHMEISGPDTGFLEDIGLISYSLNAGFFGMSNDERKAWIKRYMGTADKGRRLVLLKDLHEKALSQPVIVPLLVAPYAALARNNWKIGLSQLYANNQLWLVQAN